LVQVVHRTVHLVATLYLRPLLQAVAAAVRKQGLMAQQVVQAVVVQAAMAQVMVVQVTLAAIRQLKVLQVVQEHKAAHQIIMLTQVVVVVQVPWEPMQYLILPPVTAARVQLILILVLREIS
jgi:hypothetical protein